MLFFLLLKLSLLSVQAMEREEQKQNPSIKQKKQSASYQKMNEKLKKILSECRKKFKEKIQKKYNSIYMTNDEERCLNDLRNIEKDYNDWIEDYEYIYQKINADHKNESERFLFEELKIIYNHILKRALIEKKQVDPTLKRELEETSTYIEKFLQEIEEQNQAAEKTIDAFKKYTEEFRKPIQELEALLKETEFSEEKKLVLLELGHKLLIDNVKAMGDILRDDPEDYQRMKDCISNFSEPIGMFKAFLQHKDIEGKNFNKNMMPEEAPLENVMPEQAPLENVMPEQEQFIEGKNEHLKYDNTFIDIYNRYYSCEINQKKHYFEKISQLTRNSENPYIETMYKEVLENYNNLFQENMTPAERNVETHNKISNLRDKGLLKDLQEFYKDKKYFKKEDDFRDFLKKIASALDLEYRAHNNKIIFAQSAGFHIDHKLGGNLDMNKADPVRSALKSILPEEEVLAAE